LGRAGPRRDLHGSHPPFSRIGVPDRMSLEG
jgi:hypothetical protein